MSSLSTRSLRMLLRDPEETVSVNLDGTQTNVTSENISAVAVEAQKKVDYLKSRENKGSTTKRKATTFRIDELENLRDLLKGTSDKLAKKAARAAESAATASSASSFTVTHPSRSRGKIERGRKSNRSSLQFALEERKFATAATSSASSTCVVLRRSLNSEVVRLFPRGEVDKEEEEEESDAAAWDSDSEIAEESDEENSRPTIVNTTGKVVDIALSEAQIKRHALGRGPKWVRKNAIRVEGGFSLTQVLPRLPRVNAVKISVIEMTLKNPSRRYPDQTITLLVQVPPGTHDARSLVCFEMSYIERTFDTLTAKPKKGKALFNFNHSTKRKATQLIDRLKNSLEFKMVLSMERNAAGNKGYHDLNKEVYSEDMVWLFGHRLLEVDEQGNLVTDNLGLIHHNTEDNPAWSFTNLPRC